MAQQNGPIQIKGSIGNITFFRNQDGTYGAKAKGGVSKQRIATDPRFIRVRENGQEFGTGGKCGKVFRAAFQALLGSADSRMTSRLHKIMMDCLHADTTNARGMRTVVGGNPLLVLGFDFNVNGKLSTTLLTPYTSTISRASGAVSLTIPAFVPVTSLSAPAGATHYKITTAAAEVDYAGGTSVSDIDASTFLPLDNTATAPLTLALALTANSTLPVYQALGIHFYQEVNGEKYALNSGAYDAVSIVNADV